MNKAEQETTGGDHSGGEAVSAWTPGPWEFRFIFRMIRAVRNHQKTLAIMMQPDDARDAADAHLMAAAPDLYEALEDMLWPISAGCQKPTIARCKCPNCTVDRARATLAKARGESL